MQEARNTKTTYSRKDSAEYLGISVVTLDRAVAGKKIDHCRVGTRVIFLREHLDGFLKAHEQKAQTTARRGLLGREGN
jgi:excisionase family DNA binding protein